jgi:hypothetical protein
MTLRVLPLDGLMMLACGAERQRKDKQRQPQISFGGR